MTVDVERVATKQYLLFETGPDRQCQFDRRQVLSADQTDGRFSEVNESNPLHGSCRLGGEAFTPKPANKRPLDLWLRPVVRKPQADRSSNFIRGALDHCIRPKTPQLPMPDHACHGSPAFAFGQGPAEGEFRAFQIGIVLVQSPPIVTGELTQQEARSVDCQGHSHCWGSCRLASKLCEPNAVCVTTHLRAHSACGVLSPKGGVRV